MIGQTISHYKILEKLGEGGMGVVYKAHDTDLDRDVALKFLPNYLASGTSEKERFYHEARAASALNHPNITTIHEIGRAEDHLFIAMEYVEGKTLKQLIEKESISLIKVLEFAIQICEGLALAAEKGVVHRDIKSDNIMVTPKGQVKIMDFGLAKLKGASRLTKAGSTVGTAAYMSPEQAQGEEVDHRSDIFSFGVVLYEVLTSKLPFRGEHQAALIYSLINEDPPPIARFNHDVTPEIDRVVAKALAKLPEDRYQHIDELLADLRRERKQIEYARTGYVKASTSAITAVQPHRLSKRLMQYLGLALSVIFIAVLVLVFNPFNFQLSMQKSTAAGKNSLAVMYFQNIPDPEDKDHTGDMLAELLVTALCQTRDLDVISRERLYDIQKDLGKADAKSISPELATQVARRASVSTMLLGNILQKEPVLVVTARLIEVETGKILGSQRLTSFTSRQIFNLVDSLALLVLRDMKTTSGPVVDVQSVAEVTTKSPEAYRSYVEGKKLAVKLSLPEAKAALQRAVELDGDFAMAHFWLGIVHGFLGEGSAYRKSLRRAVELSDKATERERLHILTSSYSEENNLSKALSTAQELVEKYPLEMFGYLQLAGIYGGRLEYEKQANVYRRGLKVDPSFKWLWNVLSYASARLDDKDNSFDAIDQYLKLAPGEPNPYDSKGDIYALFGEYDSSRIWYTRSNAFGTNFSHVKLGFDAIVRQDYKAADSFSVKGESFNALIPMHRGRFEDSRRILTEVLPLHKSENNSADVETDCFILEHLAYEKGDFTEMLRLARECSSEAKKNPNEIFYGRDHIAWALSKSGSSSSVQSMLSDLKKDLNPELPELQVTFDYVMGLLAFEEAKYRFAVEQFRKAYRRLPPNHDPNLPFAISLFKSGEIDEAVAQFERLAQWFPLIGASTTLHSNPASTWYWPISSVKAHYWLGVVYEQQGDKQKAVKEYETFLNIWKDADFDSRELKDAKVRVGKLREVGSK